MVFMRGSGSWLYDMEDNRYLDFTSGIAVNSTGHCHPKVTEAIRQQAGTLIHTSVVGHHRLNIQLAEKLGELCPFFNQPQVFFSNSGAEAIDGSIKLSRIVTGKPGLVCFRSGFHGRTFAATSLTTAKDKYRKGYQPLMSDVHLAPYGENLLATTDLLNKIKSIGAIIVEPVLGEGGYIIPERGWLQGLRQAADNHGALLVFDEVQTGIGRTGRPFAAETFGVSPDVLLFAKGVASGLPLGGIIANRSLLDQWETGKHGSTFGGNPVSCAAALATLDILEPLYDRVRDKGAEILDRLQHSLPCPVRGIGFMIGIELDSKEQADGVRERCLQEGLIVLACGPDENVIRLIPPLTVTDHELEFGLTILEGAINRTYTI